MSSDPSFGFEVAHGYRLRYLAILVLGLRWLMVAGYSVQQS